MAYLGTKPSVATSLVDNIVTADKIAPNAIVTDLGYTPLSPSNNLSDLSSASTARSNLALGSLATRDSIVDIASAQQVTGSYSAGTWYTLFNHSAVVGNTGVYFFRAYADTYATGDSYQELYSGWYSVGNINTNSTISDSLYTVRGGHAPNSSSFSFRLLRQGGSVGGNIIIQFNCNQSLTLDGTSGRQLRWAVSRVSQF